MKHVEPPSPEPSSRVPLFMIGKNSRGNWVVQDQQGSCGGLFVNRAEALKFAMFENGNGRKRSLWCRVFLNSI